MFLNYFQNLSQESKKDIRDNLIFGILLFFKFFVYDVSIVPSASMTPTFLTGDLVLVNKHCIRWSLLTLPYGGLLSFGKRGWFKGLPERGTPCVFTLPGDPFTYYLKRLVGHPGDKMQMKNGILYINKQPVDMEFVDEFTYINDNGKKETGKRYKITISSKHKNKSEISYYVYRKCAYGQGHIDDTEEFEVPKGHVWMQGDNHTGSTDSFSFTLMGALPEDHLISSPSYVIINSNSRGGQDGYIVWLLMLPYNVLRYIYNINFSRILVNPYNIK